MFPVVGVAMKVHYGHNKDTIGLNLIENPIRKTVEEVAADVAADEAKRFW